MIPRTLENLDKVTHITLHRQNHCLAMSVNDDNGMTEVNMSVSGGEDDKLLLSPHAQAKFIAQLFDGRAPGTPQTPFSGQAFTDLIAGLLSLFTGNEFSAAQDDEDLYVLERTGK